MTDPHWKDFIVTPDVHADAFVQRVLDDARAPRWPRRAAVAAAALLVVLTGVGLGWNRAGSVAPGATLRAGSSNVTVTLSDQSTVTLSPRSEAQVLSVAKTEVVVQVTAGRAAFAIAHDPARSFRVVAGSTEVVVRGTRFAVERVGDSAIVVVEEGKVEVREKGRWVMNLEAAQRYPPALEPADAAPPSAADPVAPQPNSESPAPAEPVAAPPPHLVTPARPHLRANGPSAATPAVPVSAPAVTPPPLDAEQLFEAVRAERHAGHYAKAAELLQTLLSHFPGSAQEGLAAFELARLRMDQLGDVDGAIGPLQVALRSLPSLPLKEDAAARLVQAYRDTRRLQACETARSEYLAHFPRGIHRPSVELLCPPVSP